MKRIQLFEFEDQEWFPNWIRNSITNLIVIMNRLMGVDDVLSKLIDALHSKFKFETIVDLGSGSGGAMPEVHARLQKKYNLGHLSLIMTDLYPNQQAIERFNQSSNSTLNYSTVSVNALQLESSPKGLKTMVNCFHHMPPSVARSILHSAQKSKQPFLVYELSDNKMPTFIWWLFLPLSLLILVVMVFLMTPFVRPLTFRQLFFTYVIPVIPIFFAWDGQASMPRTYTISDYDELLPNSQPDYVWEKGYALDVKNKNKGSYLLGLPI